MSSNFTRFAKSIIAFAFVLFVSMGHSRAEDAPKNYEGTSVSFYGGHESGTNKIPVKGTYSYFEMEGDHPVYTQEATFEYWGESTTLTLILKYNESSMFSEDPHWSISYPSMFGYETVAYSYSTTTGVPETGWHDAQAFDDEPEAPLYLWGDTENEFDGTTVTITGGYPEDHATKECFDGTYSFKGVSEGLPYYALTKYSKKAGEETTFLIKKEKNSINDMQPVWVIGILSTYETVPLMYNRFDTEKVPMNGWIDNQLLEGEESIVPTLSGSVVNNSTVDPLAGTIVTVSGLKNRFDGDYSYAGYVDGKFSFSNVLNEDSTATIHWSKSEYIWKLDLNNEKTLYSNSYSDNNNLPENGWTVDGTISTLLIGAVDNVTTDTYVNFGISVKYGEETYDFPYRNTTNGKPSYHGSINAESYVLYWDNTQWTLNKNEGEEEVILTSKDESGIRVPQFGWKGETGSLYITGDYNIIYYNPESEGLTIEVTNAEDDRFNTTYTATDKVGSTPVFTAIIDNQTAAISYNQDIDNWELSYNEELMYSTIPGMYSDKDMLAMVPNNGWLQAEGAISDLTIAGYYSLDGYIGKVISIEEPEDIAFELSYSQFTNGKPAFSNGDITVSWSGSEWQTSIDGVVKYSSTIQSNLVPLNGWVSRDDSEDIKFISGANTIYHYLDQEVVVFGDDNIKGTYICTGISQPDNNPILSYTPTRGAYKGKELTVVFNTDEFYWTLGYNENDTRVVILKNSHEMLNEYFTSFVPQNQWEDMRVDPAIASTVTFAGDITTYVIIGEEVEIHNTDYDGTLTYKWDIMFQGDNEDGTKKVALEHRYWENRWVMIVTDNTTFEEEVLFANPNSFGKLAPRTGWITPEQSGPAGNKIHEGTPVDMTVSGFYTFDPNDPVDPSIPVVPTPVASIKRTELTVYPNPATEYVIVKTPKACTLSIYNITGACVASKMLVAGNNQISLSNMNHGIYLFAITLSETEKQVSRVIVQ